MPAGVHVQPAYTLRTELLPKFREAAKKEGITLAAWIISACRTKLDQSERRPNHP